MMLDPGTQGKRCGEQSDSYSSLVQPWNIFHGRVIWKVRQKGLIVYYKI
jgi:hypothetical protein